MDIATQKLDLMGRLMKVGEQKTLDRVDELLMEAEMEARTEASLADIAEGKVVSLKEFTESNMEWLREKYSK